MCMDRVFFLVLFDGAPERAHTLNSHDYPLTQQLQLPSTGKARLSVAVKRHPEGAAAFDPLKMAACVSLCR